MRSRASHAGTPERCIYGSNIRLSAPHGAAHEQPSTRCTTTESALITGWPWAELQPPICIYMHLTVRYVPQPPRSVRYTPAFRYASRRVPRAVVGHDTVCLTRASGGRIPSRTSQTARCVNNEPACTDERISAHTREQLVQNDSSK